ncbi:MAG: phosphate signaling complex protein PhoU [Bacteroidia bacterium]|nr:phosphate signaling complex protein PhoU [Bacteroidia bacterium]
MRIIEYEMRELKDRLYDMVELVHRQLDDLSEALYGLDHEAANRIRKKEKKIDKMDVKIDKRCERIIALHQPLASDLRFVVVTLKINAMLEQIGDIAGGIARKILEVKSPFEPRLLERLRVDEMTRLTKSLVAESLAAFFNENAELSKAIHPKDDRIDEIHRASFPIFVEEIQKNPERTEDLLQLFLIMRGLEKIADFAVGIAQESAFNVEGVFYRHTKERKNTLDQQTFFA